MQQSFPYVLTGFVLILLGVSVYLFMNPNRPLSLGDSTPFATSTESTLAAPNAQTQADSENYFESKTETVGTSTATTTIDTKSATTSSLTTEKPVVTLTTTGFTPKTLTVAAGTRVRFVNQSNNLMWVASDPYPTHSLYPEFDEKKAAGVGETFDFIFSKRGTWHYHNNTTPSQTGVIVVQ